MESIIETGRAFGFVEPLSPNSSNMHIKVLGILDTEIKILTEEELIRRFPPKGYVFAFEFFKFYEDIDPNELVLFSYVPMPEKKYPNWDDYKIIQKVKKFGTRLISINNFANNCKTIDLSTIELAENLDRSNFYGLAQDRFIIGKLSARNGQISSQNKYIRMWDKDDSPVVSYNNNYYLLAENPLGPYTTLDCLTDRQLIDWFRDKLKMINPEWVDYLGRTSWRREMAAAISVDNEDGLEIIRLEKVMNLLNDLHVSSEELIRLMEASDQFKQWFEKQIDIYKETYLKNYGLKIDQLEKELRDKELSIEIGLSKSRKQLKTSQQKLGELEQKIQRAQKDLDHLSREKGRLLADFSIFDSLVTNTVATNLHTNASGYIIEDQLPAQNDPVISRRELIERMQYYLSDCMFNPKIAPLVTDTVLLHHGTFVKDMELAICLIKAFGNTRFIIQQTAVDWLHFKDFWSNGLGELWRSAHDQRERLHVLVLEDINLSSPECYARPLLDMITGLRTKIPFDGSTLPPNFRIIAGKASTVSPKIGLPLLQETFKGWGHVGFNHKLTREELSEKPARPPAGFVNAAQLSEYFPDELGKAILLRENSGDIVELYDQPD
jgi:hypothetical protein